MPCVSKFKFLPLILWSCFYQDSVSLEYVFWRFFFENIFSVCLLIFQVLKFLSRKPTHYKICVLTIERYEDFLTGISKFTSQHIRWHCVLKEFIAMLTFDSLICFFNFLWAVWTRHIHHFIIRLYKRDISRDNKISIMGVILCIMKQIYHFWDQHMLSVLMLCILLWCRYACKIVLWL